MSGGNTRAKPCRVVVLLSGNGSNLQAILEFFKEDPAVCVAAVLSNRADAGGLERAKAAGIATEVLLNSDFPDRDAFDQGLAQRIDGLGADLIVLAGFMRILSPPFVRHFEGRLLNIHPSLLPRHRGLNTHQKALDAGDTEHGATVHFVNTELDGGPAIVQARIPVYPEDGPEELATRVLRREHEIYPMAIKWFCDGRLSWQNQSPWFDGKPLLTPRVLTSPKPTVTPLR